MNVHSSSFPNGESIPQKHAFNGMGCTGENVSPQLSWDGVPDGAKSFAVVMHDPDAPTSGGFYHWVMFNIPGDARELPEGAGGKHLGQMFSSVALDTEKLPLDGSTTGAKLEFMASQHTLAKAHVAGLYARHS